MDFKGFLTRKRDKIKRIIPEKNIENCKEIYILNKKIRNNKNDKKLTNDNIFLHRRFDFRTLNITDLTVPEKMCYKSFST